MAPLNLSPASHCSSSSCRRLAQLGAKSPFFAIIIVETIITASLRKRTAAVLHSTEHALEDLHLLSSLLARLEREEFDSPRLQALKTELSFHHLAGSKAIARLRTIVEYIDSLDNPIMCGPNIPLLYSVQLAYAAEAWRSAHGAVVRSSACSDRRSRGAPIPLRLQLRGPLRPPSRSSSTARPASTPSNSAIPSFRLINVSATTSASAAKSEFSSVSGSNMSGKSTLLRAVGINTVLAMAGAPVRAQHMQLTPLPLPSILINDSLQEGNSRFYAEITRLRHICDLAENHPPVLFLLDELLQGTNSKDRLIGAEGVVHALGERCHRPHQHTRSWPSPHVGGQKDARLHNVHLQDEIENGKMKFDFKLQDGVVTKSNGIELMRLIGLKV